MIINRKPAAQKSILVIEDEEALCEILQEELAAVGYKVTIARNGLEGLSRLQDIEPDVIICDRNMPAMSGHELLERLRNVYPQYKHLPFIFLTALSDPRDKHAVAHLRPYAYLEKPLDFQLLKRTIEEALGE
ncbi:MAG: response regulator [Micavibrio aeruginosavorus]|uniref:Response regulator n=1 Tax=Micavibrio aeruginosavorus TaxID=349221 RepID=A0A7T5UGK7_9BACT|nr:MAG: response regulator [Micavibrio aeruginosavorus]